MNKKENYDKKQAKECPKFTIEFITSEYVLAQCHVNGFSIFIEKDHRISFEVTLLEKDIIEDFTSNFFQGEYVEVKIRSVHKNKKNIIISFKNPKITTDRIVDSGKEELIIVQMHITADNI